jgi:hypothetical protein
VRPSQLNLVAVLPVSCSAIATGEPRT